MWDQDPELVRDFRIIREYELNWKQQQEQLQKQKAKLPGTESEMGGGGDLEGLINDMLNERDLEEGPF